MSNCEYCQSPLDRFTDDFGYYYECSNDRCLETIECLNCDSLHVTNNAVYNWAECNDCNYYYVNDDYNDLIKHNIKIYK